MLFAADLRHNKDRSEGKEGSSNKRKACGDAGNQGCQASKTKQTENLKHAAPRNRKNVRWLLSWLNTLGRSERQWRCGIWGEWSECYVHLK